MALANLLEGEEEAGDITLEARGLIATIFDLARRGYIEIIETEKKKFFGLLESKEQVFVLTEKGKKELENSQELELTDFEHEILSFVFSCGSEPNKVSSSEITNYCKKNRYNVKRKIQEIDKKARDWFEKNIFPITEKKSSKIMNTYGLISTIGLFITFIATKFFSILCLLPSISFIISIFATRTISRRTPESMFEVKRWKAFRKFILDFSEMKEAPATLLYVWDEYLVYAIVLGVAKVLLENLKELSIKLNQPIRGVGWYSARGITKAGTIAPESISGFISSLSSTINALSSSSSVGGGFSGGGGGGGGGGGSGAG